MNSQFRTIANDVAVVIPTHNRVRTLVRALESVKDQTLSPALTVVVDDVGDATVRDLVSTYSDSIGAVYVDMSGREPKTAGASRNDGARLVPTRWIAFLDDDDFWEPEYLHVAVSQLERVGADAWSCHSYIEHNGEIVADWQRPSVPKRRRRGLPPGGVTGSNLVISAVAFHAIGGYDSSLPVWNDLDLELRFHRANLQLTVCRRNLVGASADGMDHLTSASIRRANGLRAFLRKNRDEMSIADRRRLGAAMHSSYAQTSTNLLQRVRHRSLQAACTAPRELAHQLASRGKRPFS